MRVRAGVRPLRPSPRMVPQRALPGGLGDAVLVGALAACAALGVRAVMQGFREATAAIDDREAAAASRAAKKQRRAGLLKKLW